MSNPQEQLGKIADKLKEKADSCGLDAVETFVDKLDSIKEKAASGPQDMMNVVKGKIEEFQDMMKKAMENPSSLAPSTGGLVQCAAWYGNAVVEKLKALSQRVEDLVKLIVDLVSKMVEPLKSLGDTLDTVIAALEKSLKKLAKLPKEIKAMASDLGDLGDIAKIDTEPMKKCLDISCIDAPLEQLGGLKDVLESAVDAVKNGVQDIGKFIDEAPDMVREAFNVPTPLCFMSGVLLSQAPEAMKTMLENIDKLKEVNLDGVVQMLEDTGETICKLDVAKVKDPASSFSEQALEQIEDLDGVVSAAKLASGAGGLTSNIKSLFG